MIVKYTFKDNDFKYIDIIKQYLEDGGITVTDYYADDSDLADQVWEEMRALRYIYDLYNKNYFTEEIVSLETYNKIINRIYFLLKDNITRYLYRIFENNNITMDKLVENIGTIINDLEISLVSYIPGTSKYTGNVYYLPDLENYIIL